MERQAIAQAECTNCDDEDAEFRVLGRDMRIEHEVIKFDARCSCGADEIIVIDNQGTHASSGVSYEDATWNQSDDSDSSV